MSDQILDVGHSTALVRRDSVLLMPVMDIPTALARLKEFQAFCAEYLQESKDGGEDGGDYGIIPGTKKKTLLKSGAEKLCEIYGLADEYIMLREVEEWDRGLFAYTLKCVLKSRRDDSLVGEGVGSCSTYESKYRWRDEQRRCPHCGQSAIIKGKAQFGGGWLCWAKKGGCGYKFAEDEKAITDQTIGRVENPDIIDARNTALKMAKKRAKIDAVIGATRSSGLFTQDLDEIQTERSVNVEAQPVKQPQNSPAVQTPEPAMKDDRTITQAMQKRLWAITRSEGWKDADVKAWLKERYQLASSGDILRAEYDLIIQRLKDESPHANVNAKADAAVKAKVESNPDILDSEWTV